MKATSLIFLFLLSNLCYYSNVESNENKPLKVGVIDTGLDLSDPRFEKYLCPEGHKDFTNESFEDFIGHGTHVSGLITKYAGKGNYCLLIYKYYSSSVIGRMNVINEIKAFKEAIKNGAKIINFSSGGPTFIEDEYLLIKNNPHVLFVVAAGNDNKSLDDPNYKFYPASYMLPNMRVVANYCDGAKAKASNYGPKIKYKECGQYVKSFLPGDITGYKSGTSMSTAIETGKIVREILNESK